MPYSIRRRLSNLRVLSRLDEAERLYLTGIMSTDGVGSEPFEGRPPHSFRTLIKRLFPGRVNLTGIDLGTGPGWFINELDRLLGADFRLTMYGTNLDDDRAPPGMRWSNEEALERLGEKSMDFVSINASFPLNHYQFLDAADRFVKDGGVIYFTGAKVAVGKAAAWLLAHGHYVAVAPPNSFSAAPKESHDAFSHIRLISSRTPHAGFSYLTKLGVYHFPDQSVRGEIAEKAPKSSQEDRYWRVSKR